MLPLACFAALAVVGQTLNVLIGLAIEKYLTNATSILVFFVMFLAVFWLSWKITAWIVDRHERSKGSIGRQHLVLMLTTATQLPILV
jgi:uncharacterized protein HemY